MGALIQSVLNRSREFVKARGGEAPKYLVLDAATYRALRQEFRASSDEFLRDTRLSKILGMPIVVVPVPEMLTVVGDPWEEADRESRIDWSQR